MRSTPHTPFSIFSNSRQFYLQEGVGFDAEVEHSWETTNFISINGYIFTQVASFNGGDPVMIRSHLID